MSKQRSKELSNRSLVTEPGQHSIIATSVFKAPRELVFKVMTDPETIPQWWGPSSLTTTVDKMEPWSGGSWRYIVSDGKGHDWRFHGVYHTIEAPVRNIFTYEDEDLPGKVSLETTIYEDYDGGTRVIVTSVYQTVEDRDAMMASGMQEGGNETMDRLGALLDKMQAQR
jgi:uncharacterized protein YndB with AHSA1/START domain